MILWSDRLQELVKLGCFDRIDYKNKLNSETLIKGLFPLKETNCTKAD